MGLVSRVIEEQGIATVNVSTGRDITQNVLPPRSVFVNHPMGNPFGRKGDAQLQREILCAALRLVENCTEAGTIEDLPYEWGEKILTVYDLDFGFNITSPDSKTGRQQT